MRRIVAILLALLVTATVSAQKKGKATADTVVGQQRLEQVFRMINDNYVDTPDMNNMSEVAINAMLKALDPHSLYITSSDVQKANEGLQGNFDGVGISFQILKDTIRVVDVISGGPSEKVGIMPGDKILTVDGKAAVGDSIDNDFVQKHLRGLKGTKVQLQILRGTQTLQFNVTRDKIPIYSIDTYFMANDTVGYIRLIRFARTSVREFRNACGELRKQGMTSLILDLRGNTGGFLDVAYGLANEFLSGKKLIVYTEGRTQKRQNFVSNNRGVFKEGKLAVLIDEGSASASEIVAGAVQDWDRGVLVGRRSFGKGLVQRMYTLDDGGQVRLTTARYYTPSGRCIQRPYDKGSDAYRSDFKQRYDHGELVCEDSIQLPDSLKYKTHGGRVVYGGGGIMPDIFVPMDTTRLSDFFVEVRGKGLLNEFTLQWADKHRDECKQMGFEKFLAQYDSFRIDSLFAAAAENAGVKRDVESESAQPERIRKSDEYQHLVLKALIAKSIFGTEYYYKIMCVIDDVYLKALSEY